MNSRTKLAVGLFVFAVAMIGGSLVRFQLEDAGVLASLPDKRWIAAGLFGAVGFGSVTWSYRASWRHFGFWGWLCAALVFHTLGFYEVLRSFPQWPVVGTLLVSLIEVFLFSLLLTARGYERSTE